MERRVAAAISAVLDNDDLVSEILLCLTFPTSLVRAALVCKRWLRVASAPPFLHHFRDLHPPHLLGFYVVTTYNNPPRFVPLPQAPELAFVVHQANFDLDTMGSDRLDVDCCWNGLLVITIGRNFDVFANYKRSVYYPLDPTRHISILPPLRETSVHDGFTYYYREIIPNGGGDGQPYFCLSMGCKEQQSVLDVYVLKDDTWAIYSSVITEIHKIRLLLPDSLVVDDRIYNLARVGGTLKLFLLDLLSSCLSLVNLPEQVEELLRTDLSLENDSEVHLIYVKGSQLCIWLYMVDTANWLLLNTICLRGICHNHMIPTSIFENVGVLVVYAVGASSGLFFLDVNEVFYLFDIKRKTAKKVFEVTQEGTQLHQIRPFMMIWPPKFPVMKEGCDPKQ